MAYCSIPFRSCSIQILEKILKPTICLYILEIFQLIEEKPQFQVQILDGISKWILLGGEKGRKNEGNLFFNYFEAAGLQNTIENAQNFRNPDVWKRVKEFIKEFFEIGDEIMIEN